MRQQESEEIDIRRHWFAILTVCLTGILNVLSWSVLLWKIPYSSNPIRLHYNIYYGVDLTGDWPLMFVIPGSALIIGILHGVLVWFIPSLQRIAAWILLVMAVVIQAIAVLASLLVVLLNSSL